MLIATVTRHFSEHGPVVTTVEARLGGTASAWYRSGAQALRRVSTGDACLLFDAVDGEVSLCIATDLVRDGKARVFAYEPSGRGTSRRVTGALRDRLIRLGLSRTKHAFRTQWVDRETAMAIIDATFGSRAMGKFRDL